MRRIRTAQASIFEVFAEHEIGRELQAMSTWLDEHPALLGWVGKDLGVAAGQQTGREGMTAESVLRCGLLKQYRQLSYEELAFYLLDSASFQAFARLPIPQEVGPAVEYRVYQGRDLGAGQRAGAHDQME